mmetsp:Transcript_12910/g.26184  ORF Transcript_12910/g.26184 Transcript_12910/m.26184 type:complete len:281 (-) Transcript_12910:168-1010(-)
MHLHLLTRAARGRRSSSLHSTDLRACSAFPSFGNGERRYVYGAHACVDASVVAHELAAGTQAQLIPCIHGAQLLVRSSPLRVGVEEGLDDCIHGGILHNRSDASSAHWAVILPAHPVGATRHAEVVRARRQCHALVDGLHADRADHQLVQLQALDLFRNREALGRVPKDEGDHLIVADPVGREDANLVARAELPRVPLADDAAVHGCAVGRAVVQEALVGLALQGRLGRGALLAAVLAPRLELEVQERRPRVREVQPAVLVTAHRQDGLICRQQAECQEL